MPMIFSPSSTTTITTTTTCRRAINVHDVDKMTTNTTETAIVLPLSTLPSPKAATTRTPAVPTTMSQAIRVFFFSGDYGPSMIVVILMGVARYRLDMATAVTGMDVVAFIVAVLFWWIQEHVLHDKVLHSQVDWIGKQIHQGHHDKPYYHISIDPAALLLGWMAMAHCLLFRWWLPLPIALSATLGYSMAGLFYEWAHYIVHTKVRFNGVGSRFWTTVRDNHVRHHRISSMYWYAFSVPWIDDLFQSNPDVKDVQTQLRLERSE
jgi:hypothetical protein